jgi:hypothetical protein
VRGSPEALSGDPLTDPADVWSRGSPDRQISADWRSVMSAVRPAQEKKK